MAGNFELHGSWDPKNAKATYLKSFWQSATIEWQSALAVAKADTTRTCTECTGSSQGFERLGGFQLQ